MGKSTVRHCLNPEADITSEQGYYSRRGPRPSEKIAVIWQELLKQEKVGIRDNFFDIGGHSLLAMQLLVRMNKLFYYAVAITRLFDAKSYRSVS
ncbi:MAG: phosphopantetheine-binding protein [Desulfobacterales bacterium]|nr:phosphopantetheine-binding protein [Desulfobacterales bacterium]